MELHQRLTYCIFFLIRFSKSCTDIDAVIDPPCMTDSHASHFSQTKAWYKVLNQYLTGLLSGHHVTSILGKWQYFAWYNGTRRHWILATRLARASTLPQSEALQFGSQSMMLKERQSGSGLCNQTKRLLYGSTFWSSEP